MKSIAILTVGLALVGALVACGDALVEGTYRGEALFIAEGRVEVLLDTEALEHCYEAEGQCEQQATTEDEEDVCEAALRECITGATDTERPWERTPDRLRLALFWTRDGLSSGIGGAGLVEQGGQTIGRFPGLFDLRIYRPPSPEVLRSASDGGQYAIAVVALYLDDDRDELWNATRDRLVGGARSQTVIYTPEGFDDERIGAFGPGWHRLSFELDCEEQMLSIGDPEPGPMRLGLTERLPVLQQVLIDFDCDGSYEDTCEDPEVQAECAAGSMETICLICADEEEDDDDEEEEDDDD